jgi:hypothetical protein
MIDENAFGLLVSYFDIEDDEYSLEREEFVQRFRLFREVVLQGLVETRAGAAVRAVDLGHVIYWELAQEDDMQDPIGWLRTVRERLARQSFATVGVLSHGGRWVCEDDTVCDTPGLVEGVTLVSASSPSEPLRRALYAETQTHPDETTGSEGWGPGLYIDTEAVEALGRRLKNAPTPLSSAGATFYRMGG